MRPNPILIPEISRIVCTFVDTKDLLNLALSCRALYYTSCFRLWNNLSPKSHRVLRKIKNTLDQTSVYNKYVWKFCLSAKEDNYHLERFFFDSFLFPNLRQLEFSNAAAQDHIVYPIITAASKSLISLNLSQCYCLSTAVVRPLLTMPAHQLESLVLYGCGKIDSSVMAGIIYRHANTLKRLRLTDINDTIIEAIQTCKRLNDLGLEHCGDTTLTNSALNRFFLALSESQVQLTHLRLRDIDSLTSSHIKTIALSSSRSLVSFDMSECNRINSQGISWLATECTNLRTLLLAYQAGVSNQAIKLFVSNCHQLKHVDVSGCRLLTDHAFFPLLDEDNLMKSSLETLNLSGLDLLSATLIHQLLNKIDSLQELCLGVTYDLDEADRILEVINSGEIQFFIDIDKLYTIIRISSSTYQQSLAGRRAVIATQPESLALSLPSASTWHLPPLL